MKEQYTDKAKQVLKYAKKISGKLGHSYVGTEHILLGLIKQKESLAGSVLAGFHLEENKVLDYIDQLIAPVELTTSEKKEGYTPRAEKVLEDARMEADRFHEKKIGTEHLLIAILKDFECIAAKLLKTLNVNAKEVYIDGNCYPYTKFLKSGSTLKDPSTCIYKDVSKPILFKLLILTILF